MEIVDIPLKKSKLEDYSHVPFSNLTHIPQLYGNLEPIYLKYLQYYPRNSLSAFKPFMQSLKEGKPRHGSAYNNHSRYSDPPLLQNPERVVPITQTERFEGTYQPNVALAPPMGKKYRYIRQHIIDQANQASQANQSANPKEPVYNNKAPYTSPNEVSSSSVQVKDTKIESPPLTNSVIKHEKYSSVEADQNLKNVIQKSPDSQSVIDSTVSVVQSTGSLTRYNSEIELSTDTDDSASEVSDKPPELVKLEDALKDVEGIIREKVLDMFRSLTKDHENTIQECKNKENRIIELENELTILKDKLRVYEKECKAEPPNQILTSVIVNDSTISNGSSTVTTSVMNGPLVNGTVVIKRETHTPNTNSTEEQVAGESQEASSTERSPIGNEENSSCSTSSILYPVKNSTEVEISPVEKQTSVIAIIEKTIVENVGDKNVVNTQEEAIIKKSPD